MLEVIKKPTDPKYTLFVPFTRLWFVDIFLAQLTILSLPRQDTEVVFYNDSNIPLLHDKLYNWLSTYALYLNGAVLYTSGNSPLGENDIMARRRNRIVEMKRNSINIIGNSEYVFGLEDDALVPTDAFSRLLGHIDNKSSVGIASGVQMGRWRTQMVGVWKIEPVIEPRIVRTVPFNGGDEADGVGWYCYVTRTNLYKRANYRYEAECLGPDVCYAWDLRKQGYKVAIDWSVICPHVTQYGIFIPREDNTETIEWVKEGDSWNVPTRPTI